MAIGRTFKEALQKGLRALESGRTGWVVGERLLDDRLADDSLDTLRAALATPTPERIFQVKRAMLADVPLEEIHRITAIDLWFLSQLRELVEAERSPNRTKRPGAR
jgi:carbamoyl-phosphate synthase large subunit